MGVFFDQMWAWSDFSRAIISSTPPHLPTPLLSIISSVGGGVGWGSRTIPIVRGLQIIVLIKSESRSFIVRGLSNH